MTTKEELTIIAGCRPQSSPPTPLTALDIPLQSQLLARRFLVEHLSPALMLVYAMILTCRYGYDNNVVLSFSFL
jgi:hypothetical protein